MPTSQAYLKESSVGISAVTNESAGARFIPLAVFLSVLLSGCFASASIPSSIAASESQPSGKIFGSIGSSGTDRTLQLRLVNYRRAGSEGPRERGQFLYHTAVGGLSTLISPLYATPKDFSQGASHGTVFILRLPPGDYEIYSAFFTNSPGGGFAAHMSSTPLFAKFSVEVGKATYLGEFLSHEKVERDQHGIPTFRGAYFTVNDKLARDMEILGAKGERLARSEVINASPEISREFSAR